MDAAAGGGVGARVFARRLLAQARRRHSERVAVRQACTCDGPPCAAVACASQPISSVLATFGTLDVDIVDAHVIHDANRIGADGSSVGIGFLLQVCEKDGGRRAPRYEVQTQSLSPEESHALLTRAQKMGVLTQYTSIRTLESPAAAYVPSVPAGEESSDELRGEWRGEWRGSATEGDATAEADDSVSVADTELAPACDETHDEAEQAEQYRDAVDDADAAAREVPEAKPWSPEEDDILLQAVAEGKGRHRWKPIAERLPGRTKSSARNRLNRILNAPKKISQREAEGRVCHTCRVCGEYSRGHTCRAKLSVPELCV